MPKRRPVCCGDAGGWRDEILTAGRYDWVSGNRSAYGIEHAMTLLVKRGETGTDQGDCMKPESAP